MEISNFVNVTLENGGSVITDLDRKDLYVNGTLVIHNGFPCDGFELSFPQMENEVALEELKSLYYNYKHSVPGERRVKRHKKHFPALPLDKLGEDSFIMAIDRESALVRLETSVLFHSVVGNLKWSDDYGNWFYKNEDFILLKTWF